MATALLGTATQNLVNLYIINIIYIMEKEAAENIMRSLMICCIHQVFN
jgi:hypothetical protein